MFANSYLDKIALILTLTGLATACQSEPRRKPAQIRPGSADPVARSPVAVASMAGPMQPVQAPSPTQAPAAATAEMAPPPGEMAEPVMPEAEPAEATPPVKLEVEVSESPSEDPARQLLVGYERLNKRAAESVEISTDRNGSEFPGSLTRAKIRSVAVPIEEGARTPRAMTLELSLPEQRTPYAACLHKSDCGCEDTKPYAYISLSHALPTDAHLNQYKSLSFWARSGEAFELHVILSCYVQPRPQSTVAPFNGYLDAAYTQVDPCWQSPRVELPLSDPIEIRGDDVWHRYQFSVADLKPGEPVELRGGGLMECSLGKVTHVAYVLKKSKPRMAGEYPEQKGVVYFDDLEGITAP